MAELVHTTLGGLSLTTTVCTKISSRPKTFREQNEIEGLHLRLGDAVGPIPRIPVNRDTVNS